MSDNSSTPKIPDQSAPVEKAALPSQTGQVQANPLPVTDKPTKNDVVSDVPGGDQPAAAKSQPENVTIATATDKTVIHLSPITADEKVVVPPATPAADKPLAVPAQPAPAEMQAAKVIPSSSADDTLPRRPSTDKIEQKAAATPIVPPVAEPLSDLENPYLLSGEVDRARLVAQTRMFRRYIEKNAKQFVGENLKSILDVGCGEGQLTLVLARLYPDARVVGIDRDEKAIEAAQRAATGMPNVKFEVRDILQGLPTGPFDLVYESLVFQHLPSTPQALKVVYDVLKPGGYLWMKDVHPNMVTAIDHPAYARLLNWVASTMDKVGQQWRMAAALAPILSTAGFTVLRSEKEVYTMGNMNTDERITMSINLGAFYNGRKAMTRVLQVPESDVEKTYKEIVGAMMAPGGPRGEITHMNTVSQRPVQPIVPPVAEPLSDIENPYILSGDVDRARLVAQTRLFRSYIEKNAKQFVGENLKSILDIGCGEGQLTLVFAKLYPEARIVGIDKDEKAIEVARRAAAGVPNVEFQAGDILEGLPAGPFDLVYESLLLMHVPGTPKVIKSIYDVLKPGGRLWTKDLHPNMETAVDHPAFMRLSIWMGTTMDRIGAPWRIGGELLPILAAVGFNVLRSEKEVYALGNLNTEERITMSINLGALYNARKLMSRVLQVPESEMEKAYKEIVGAMMAPDGPRGEFMYMNTISQHPVRADQGSTATTAVS